MKLRNPPTDTPAGPPNAPNGHGDALAAFLRRTYLGPRQFHKALSLWPLLPTPGAPGPNGLDYVPLADALEEFLRSLFNSSFQLLIHLGDNLR